MSIRTASIALVVTVAAGCIVDDDLGTDEQEIGPISFPCPKWGCGTNKPEIYAIQTHDMSERFGPANRNNEGFYIRSAHQGFVSYTISVTRDKLSARRTSFPYTTITGTSLVGLRMVIENTTMPGQQWALDVKGVYNYLEYWAQNATSAGVTIETYKLEYSPMSGGVPIQEWENICSDPPESDQGAEPGDGAMGKFEAILFEGDLFDADTKRVYGYNKAMFNIGCAGGVLAKMHLMGHTTAAIPFTTTIDQKTTLLKGITADYCGGGLSFTVAGEHLSWADDNGTLRHLRPPMWPTSPTNIEARWDVNGAVCLNEPRLENTLNPDAWTAFPDIELAIKDFCGYRPPECTNTNFDDLAGLHIVTANMPP